MSTDFPNYPVFSWRPTITGTCGYNDGISSGSIDLATEIGSSYWGAAPGASEVASTASIDGRLAELLRSELSIGTPGDLAVTYTWPTGFGPQRTSWSNNHGNITLTFDSTDTAAQFGFASASVVLTSVTAKVADFNSAGYWAPRVRAAQDERWSTNPNIGFTETIDGSSRKQREWGTNLDRRAFAFPNVYVARVLPDKAAETSYATAAFRSTSDPNCTLTGLVEASRTPEDTDDARAIRVYTAANTYRTCYWLDGPPSDVEDLCENASARRLWRIAFEMRDDG